MKLYHLLLAVALVMPLVLTGCDDANPNDPGAVAPPVIAPNAFTFDGSFPEEGDAGARLTIENWANAAVRVGVVSTVIGLNLIVPSLVTNAATQADPYVESGTWVWENTVPVDGTPVTLRLEATPDGTEIDWRMFISADGLSGADYETFELYDATTSLDGKSGTWHLYYDVEGTRTRVLDAEFDVTSASVRALTFTVPETNPNPDARGSTVRYAGDGDARFFGWHQEPEDFDHLIDWSAATNAGSITADDYNNGQRACWNELLQDVACP